MTPGFCCSPAHTLSFLMINLFWWMMDNDGWWWEWWMSPNARGYIHTYTHRFVDVWLLLWWIYFRKHKNIHPFSIIAQHWDGTGTYQWFSVRLQYLQCIISSLALSHLYVVPSPSHERHRHMEETRWCTRHTTNSMFGLLMSWWGKRPVHQQPYIDWSTHWGQDKMGDIFQTTFSNALIGNKIVDH